VAGSFGGVEYERSRRRAGDDLGDSSGGSEDQLDRGAQGCGVGPLDFAQGMRFRGRPGAGPESADRSGVRG
jgi:hypothetical protein